MNGFDQIRTKARVDQALEAERTSESNQESEQIVHSGYEAERTAVIEEIRAIQNFAVEAVAAEADLRQIGMRMADIKRQACYFG